VISVFAGFRFPPEVISLAVADCGPELDDMNAIITISPRRGRREYSAIGADSWRDDRLIRSPL
jgi:hypothetical protein